MGKLIRAEFGKPELNQTVEPQFVATDGQGVSEYGDMLESVIVADLAANPGDGYTAACSQADIDLVKAWLQGRRF